MFNNVIKSSLYYKNNIEPLYNPEIFDNNFNWSFIFKAIFFGSLLIIKCCWLFSFMFDSIVFYIFFVAVGVILIWLAIVIDDPKHLIYYSRFAKKKIDLNDVFYNEFITPFCIIFCLGLASSFVLIILFNLTFLDSFTFWKWQIRVCFLISLFILTWFFCVFLRYFKIWFFNFILFIFCFMFLEVTPVLLCYSFVIRNIVVSVLVSLFSISIVYNLTEHFPSSQVLYCMPPDHEIFSKALNKPLYPGIGNCGLYSAAMSSRPFNPLYSLSSFPFFGNNSSNFSSFNSFPNFDAFRFYHSTLNKNSIWYDCYSTIWRDNSINFKEAVQDSSLLGISSLPESVETKEVKSHFAAVFQYKNGYFLVPLTSSSFTPLPPVLPNSELARILSPDWINGTEKRLTNTLLNLETNYVGSKKQQYCVTQPIHFLLSNSVDKQIVEKVLAAPLQSLNNLNFDKNIWDDFLLKGASRTCLELFKKDSICLVTTRRFIFSNTNI